MSEISREFAEEILQIIEHQQGSNVIDTALALRMIDVAVQLGREDLVGKIISHAVMLLLMMKKRAGFCLRK